MAGTGTPTWPQPTERQNVPGPILSGCAVKVSPGGVELRPGQEGGGIRLRHCQVGGSPRCSVGSPRVSGGEPLAGPRVAWRDLEIFHFFEVPTLRVLKILQPPWLDSPFSDGWKR